MTRDETQGRLTGRRLVEARLRIWAKDPHCAMCGKVVQYPGGFELDHILPLSKGGSNEDGNLQVLCADDPGDPLSQGCHSLKTGEDMGHKKRARYDSSGRVVWDR